MKLDACCGGNQALGYMERYVNEGTQTYSPFAARTEVAPQFQPRSDLPSFELVTVHAPEERVSVFQAEPAGSLREFYLRPDGVLFAVHPETWGSFGVENLDKLHSLPRGKPIQVAPTASTRTVLALEHAMDAPLHFIKLHYPQRISRFNRRLRRANIQNSVALTLAIGHEFFDCLLGVLKHFYAVDEDSERSRVKEAFHRAFPEADGFFPAQTMFYFSNEPKPGNEFTLVDMKRSPEWR
jgi:hypothetical protein